MESMWFYIIYKCNCLYFVYFCIVLRFLSSWHNYLLGCFFCVGKVSGCYKRLWGGRLCCQLLWLDRVTIGVLWKVQTQTSCHHCLTEIIKFPLKGYCCLGSLILFNFVFVFSVDTERFFYIVSWSPTEKENNLVGLETSFFCRSFYFDHVLWRVQNPWSITPFFFSDTDLKQVFGPCLP